MLPPPLRKSHAYWPAVPKHTLCNCHWPAPRARYHIVGKNANLARTSGIVGCDKRSRACDTRSRGNGHAVLCTECLPCIPRGERTGYRNSTKACPLPSPSTNEGHRSARHPSSWIVTRTDSSANPNSCCLTTFLHVPSPSRARRSSRNMVSLISSSPLATTG